VGIEKGDRVKFNRTAVTVLLGIADGYGVVDRVDGDGIVAYYDDPDGGLMGPYVLCKGDMEMLGLWIDNCMRKIWRRRMWINVKASESSFGR